MARVRYSCCKHGPFHGMGDRRCGFAHCLSDISIPTSMHLTDARLWRDQTHMCGGHAGIDWFVGQAYSPSQLERVFLYLLNDPVASWPLWAKRLAWYFDYGNREDYVSDGDLGWSDDALQYFGINVSYEHRCAPHRFPFATALDPNWGMTLEERMFERMTTGARGYNLYLAKVSWGDQVSYYASRTDSGWGKYGRQYLQVEEGCMYLRLFASPCADPWWYMVPMTALPKVLSHGGWAPPVAFDATGDYHTLYEVPLSELECVSEPVQEAVLALVPSGCIRVFVAGSTDDRQGIAAACLIAGVYSASRASLALPGMTGAEASELLGIILGLMICFQYRHSSSMFVLMVDSNNAIKHVFEKTDPVDRSGQDLWPAIALARLIVCRLEDMNIRVSWEKVSSRQNLAHHLALAELRYRRERGWRPFDDSWLPPLCEAFQEVFQSVATNRSNPGMDLPPFSFSDEVLSALDSLVCA